MNMKIFEGDHSCSMSEEKKDALMKIESVPECQLADKICVSVCFTYTQYNV